MKKIALILSCYLLILTGCDSVKRRNFVVLIDDSSSVPEELVQRYINVIQETLVSNMGAKDKLTVVFIDGCTKSRAERVYTVDLSEMSFENERDGVNHMEDSTHVRLNRFLSQVKRDVATKIMTQRNKRNDCGGATDILSSMVEVKKLVENSKNYKNNKEQLLNSINGEDNYQYQNIAVFFSDMINESNMAAYDFTLFGRLTEEEVSKKVIALKEQNKIPDLTGVKILVYGATNSRYAGAFRENQIEQVKLFWELFVQSAGAEMVGYGYDTQIELKTYMKSTRE